MKKYKSFCYVCGLPFISQSKKAKYCPQCRTLGNSWIYGSRKRTVNSEIIQDLRELEAYNKENNTKLSYGKYKAMKAQIERKK